MVRNRHTPAIVNRHTQSGRIRRQLRKYVRQSLSPSSGRLNKLHKFRCGFTFRRFALQFGANMALSGAFNYIGSEEPAAGSENDLCGWSRQSDGTLSSILQFCFILSSPSPMWITVHQSDRRDAGDTIRKYTFSLSAKNFESIFRRRLAASRLHYSILMEYAKRSKSFNSIWVIHSVRRVKWIEKNPYFSQLSTPRSDLHKRCSWTMRNSPCNTITGN